MSRTFYHPQELCLGQAACGGLPNVPASLDYGQVSLHDDHILRPFQSKGRRQQVRCVAVHSVEVPHTAQVSGREAGRIRGLCGEVLGSSHRSALLCAITDDFTDQVVQLHLRQTSRNSGAQSGKHGAVVCRLADIHGSSFPALRARLMLKAEKSTASPCFSLL